MTSPTAAAVGVFDLLATDGTATDGTAKGGPLVARGFSSNGVSTSNSGSGSVSVLTNAASSTASSYDDSGTGRAIKLVTTATLPGMALLRETVYGPHVTPRWYMDNTGTGLSPFDYVIDGEVFPVEDVLPRKFNLPIAVITPMPILQLPRAIDDGKHTVEVHLSADAAVAKSMYFVGWTVAATGYPQPQAIRAAGISSATALTTTATAINFTSTINKTLHFVNTDTVAHTVTVSEGSNNTYWTASVPANGGSADLILDPPQSITGWKAKIEATPGSGAVNYWTKGV